MDEKRNPKALVLLLLVCETGMRLQARTAVEGLKVASHRLGCTCCAP